MAIQNEKYLRVDNKALDDNEVVGQEKFSCW